MIQQIPPIHGFGSMKIIPLKAAKQEAAMQATWREYFLANKLFPQRDPSDFHVESLYAKFLQAKAAYRKAYRQAIEN